MAQVHKWTIYGNESTIQLGGQDAILLNRERSIRLQLLLHTHLLGIKISDADLECMVLLGLRTTQGQDAWLLPFCEELTQRSIFATVQSSRNSITRLQDKGLIGKQGGNKKKVFLSPSMCIQSSGNVLIDIKCFTHDSN